MTNTRTVPTLADATNAMIHGNVIGFGVFRNVYRFADSPWVFKVENRNSGATKREYANYLSLRPSLRNGVHFPEMHLLSDTIIAAEYIEGKEGSVDCWSANSHGDCQDANCWAVKLEFLAVSIYDLHYGNVLTTADGKVYVIDLGEYGDQTPKR